MTPYFASILAKLQQKGIENIVVVPNNHQEKAVGAGVKAVDHTTACKIVFESVSNAYYGKQKYDHVIEILSREQPDIVVFIWPYLLQLFFERSIIRYIKSKGIKLVLKEIPFQIPPYGQMSYFKNYPVYDENMNLLSDSVGFNLRNVFMMYIRKYLYTRIDGSLNYRSDAKDILLSYGIDKQRIHVTYNSSDTEALLSTLEKIQSTPALLPQKLRVIHIGRLVKWKRVDLLINAFSIVVSNMDKVELLIVGDGPELESLKQQVQLLNLASSVRFAGGVYDTYTLGKYMYESSIYVLAGMGGLSINDAMTYGLPIICSVCDGTEKDLVREYQNGFFFKEGDVADLADKITFLLNNQALREQFGKKSQQIITEEINVNSVSDRYFKAFVDIVNN